MLGPTHVLLAVTRKLGHFSAGELSQDSSWRGGAVRGGGGAVRDGGWAVRLWGCDCTGNSTWLTS